MFVPLFALPVALQLVAVADGVPQLNVTPSCRGAAQSGFIATTGDRLKSCIDTEQRTREQLAKDWAKFPAADRAFCVSSIAGFEPTYSELATCLEMKRDLKHQARRGGRNAPRRRDAPATPTVDQVRIVPPGPLSAGARRPSVRVSFAERPSRVALRHGACRLRQGLSRGSIP